MGHLRRAPRPRHLDVGQGTTAEAARARKSSPEVLERVSIPSNAIMRPPRVRTVLKTMGSDLSQQSEKYGFQGSNGSSIADSFACLVAALKASGDRPRPLQAARLWHGQQFTGKSRRSQQDSFRRPFFFTPNSTFDHQVEASQFKRSNKTIRRETR